MCYSGCYFYAFQSHLPFFGLPPDLGVSSLPEDLYPLLSATLGLRGVAHEAPVCWGSDSPLLPGLHEPYHPWFDIRVLLVLGTYSHAS